MLLARFSPGQLLGQFGKFLPDTALAAWLKLSKHTFYARAFTPQITLWYLIYQRLSPNHCLSAIQEDALAGGADRLSPRGKKALSQQLRSEATTSFSDARQRFPLECCRRALQRSAAHTHRCLKIPRKFGLKLALLDGSTFRLRPLGDIPKAFPAHRTGNAKKPPYWCVARVVGMVCWATGVVLDSAIGSLKTSEQTLSARLLGAQSWKEWLVSGDRNFGVYSVARAIVAAQGQALLRLTEARARKLARSAELKLKPGLDAPLDWAPTTHDQCPANVERTAVAGRLIALRVCPRGFRAFTLYLFTTLRNVQQCPAAALAQVYGLRWQIELCFRYIKVQMNLGFLECRSADMARKEWLAGLIAYNLIRWTMAAAAALAKVPVQWLSFSHARQLLLGWCLRHANSTRARHSWKTLLMRVAKARLPQRRKPRPPEPRAARPFQKDVAKLYGSRSIARKQLAKLNAKS